jgi:hypothetical protein
MANPNIVNVTSILGNTAYVTPSAAATNTFNWTFNGATALPGLIPAVNTVNRVTEISVANTTSSAVTATVIVGSAAIFTASIGTTSLTVSATTQGTIAIGQTLYTTGAGFTAGTTITAGSASPYTVSSSQTVSSSTFYAIASSAYMAYQISVPPNATLIVIDKTNSLYITENQGIMVASGTAGALTFAATFEAIT